YLLEAAKAYWLKAYSEKRTNSGETMQWLTRAYQLIEDAIRHSTSSVDPFFRAQLYNVRAFVCCELALQHEVSADEEARVELERAAASVAEIERLIPEAEWIGRFYDTRAWFAFA